MLQKKDNKRGCLSQGRFEKISNGTDKKEFYLGGCLKRHPFFYGRQISFDEPKFIYSLRRKKICINSLLVI